MENKCIQCGKLLLEEHVHWCDMKCKEEFYKKYYQGSSLVKMIDDAEKQRMDEYKKSDEYKKFMKRVDEIGFCKALQEIKMKYKTEQERLDNGLCPQCEGCLVKAGHLPNGQYHSDDKHSVCEECGWEDTDC